MQGGCWKNSILTFENTKWMKKKLGLMRPIFKNISLLKYSSKIPYEIQYNIIYRTNVLQGCWQECRSIRGGGRWGPDVDRGEWGPWLQRRRCEARGIQYAHVERERNWCLLVKWRRWWTRARSGPYIANGGAQGVPVAVDKRRTSWGIQPGIIPIQTANNECSMISRCKAHGPIASWLLHLNIITSCMFPIFYKFEWK